MKTSQTLEIHIKNIENLVSMYIPWLREGGIFIPSSYLTSTIKQPQMNDFVNLVIFFEDKKIPYILQGEVVLIQPKKRGQEIGIGLEIQFDLNHEFMNLVHGKMASIDRNKHETYTY